MMLSAPSPAPTDDAIGMLGTFAPDVPPVAVFLELLQAARVAAASRTAAVAVITLFIWAPWLDPGGLGPAQLRAERGPRPERDSRRGGPDRLERGPCAAPCSGAPR